MALCSCGYSRPKRGQKLVGPWKPPNAPRRLSIAQGTPFSSHRVVTVQKILPKNSVQSVVMGMPAATPLPLTACGVGRSPLGQPFRTGRLAREGAGRFGSISKSIKLLVWAYKKTAESPDLQELSAHLSNPTEGEQQGISPNELLPL